MIEASLIGWLVPAVAVASVAGATASFFYVPVIGHGLAAGLGGIAVAAFVYGAGFNERGALDHSAALSVEIVTLTDEIATMQKANEVAAAVAADARIAQQNAEDHAALAQQDVDAYEAELAKRKTPACVLSPDDVVRLRGIGAARGSATPQPPARPLDLRHGGSGAGAK